MRLLEFHRSTTQGSQQETHDDDAISSQDRRNAAALAASRIQSDTLMACRFEMKL
jgi:hypothetical protein